MLNGASSSGKSTLAAELSNLLPEPFLYFSFDHFRDADILPMRRINSGEFAWAQMRESVFGAYHHCLLAIAASGCNVLAEHIIENEDWCATLRRLLGELDVFLVAVKCPNEELAKREEERGDRNIGDALRDAPTCYNFCDHDIEVDSTISPRLNAERIIEYWLTRDQSKVTRFRHRNVVSG